MSLTYPFVLTNGQTADANQVMANFNAVATYLAGSVATAGANFNITSLGGLTTPISIAQGGTGATTGPGAISNLGGLLAANNLTDVPFPLNALIHLGGIAKVNNLSDVASTTTSLNNLLPSQTGQTGQFLTTDGVGGVSWGSPQIATTYAQFRNQQISGTASGEVLGNAAWTQRILNTTILNNITGASLAANQITLPAGVYEVTASGSAQVPSVTANPGSYNHKLRVRNITDSTTLVVGQNCAASVNGTTVRAEANATLQGRFTLNNPKVIELDSWTNGASSSNGGSTISSGEAEVYCDIYLRKIG